MATNQGRPFVNWTGSGPTFMHGMGKFEGDAGDAFLYELDSNTTPWNEVENFGDSSFIGALAMFGGDLYVGLENRNTPVAQVDVSGDGNNFSTDKTFVGQRQVMSMEVFGGKLYVGTRTVGGTSPEIHSRTGGGTWTLEETFTIFDQSIDALKVFGGFIYAAVTRRPADGNGSIFRSSDGITWSSVHTFASSREKVTDLEVFSGKIYALTFEKGADTTEIWESSDGTSWSLNNTFTTGESNLPTQMATDGTRLFVGLEGSSEVIETAKIFEYNGTSWTLSIDFNDGGGFGSSHVGVFGVGHDTVSGKIYCSTGDLDTGGGGEVDIYTCPTADASGGG
jgi:hypothetical protein